MGLFVGGFGLVPHAIAGRAPHAEGASRDAPIIEATRQGAWLRVTAICPRTGAEATAAGPAHAPAMLERLALAKLARKRAG